MSRLALLLLGLALAACSAPLQRFEYARAAMGTEFRLVFYAPGRARAEAAAEAAFARIAALDRALSDYDPESELSRLGARSDAAAPSPWMPVSRELFTVLAAGQEVARASRGAFDVTLGPYTKLWRRARRQEELPPAELLAQAAAAVGYERLELDPCSTRVRLHARGMRLDLGGIAKGYALDQALDALAAHGLERALVDGGGDVAVRAPPPGRAGWSLVIAGLESADPHADRASRWIELAHAALATSGDLERAFELDGQRHSHILDPRTGRALRERCLASVRAPDGLHADAWATALAVLGPEEGLALLARVPGAAGRLARARDGALELFESQGFPAALSCDASLPSRPVDPCVRLP